MATRKQRTITRAKNAVKMVTPALQVATSVAKGVKEVLSPQSRANRQNSSKKLLSNVSRANLQGSAIRPSPIPTIPLNFSPAPKGAYDELPPIKPVYKMGAPIVAKGQFSPIPEDQQAQFSPAIEEGTTNDSGTSEELPSPLPAPTSTRTYGGGSVASPVQASVARSSAPTTSTTLAQAQTTGGSPRSYLVGTNQIEDPVYKNLMRELRATAQTDVDEDDIKRRTLREYQSQIDAINSVYNDLLSRAQQGGQQNLGTERAIQGRSGLLGSDFGVSRTQGVQRETRQEMEGIEGQRSLDLSGIYENSRNYAQSEIARLRDLKKSGVEGYLEAINTERETMDSGLSQVVMDAVSQGFDIDTIGQDAIDTLAKVWKTTKEVVRNKIRQAVASSVVAPEYFNLSEGQSRYMIDPETGETVMIANSPKTYKPTTSTSGDSRYGGVALSKTQQSKVDLINSTMSSLEEYRSLYDSLVNESGHRLTGQRAGELAGFYNALMFQIAQASGTGALQKADRDIVESMIPNPTTLGGATKTKIRGGKTGALGAIDQARNVFENSKNAIIGQAGTETVQPPEIEQEEYAYLKELGYSDEEISAIN